MHTLPPKMVLREEVTFLQKLVGIFPSRPHIFRRAFQETATEHIAISAFKVNIYKSHGGVSLLEQPTIECVLNKPTYWKLPSK